LLGRWVSYAFYRHDFARGGCAFAGGTKGKWYDSKLHIGGNRELVMRHSTWLTVLWVLLGVGAGPVVYAHTPDISGGALDGLIHPFTGLDHLLAMLAVGLWAAQRSGRAVVVLPAAFVATLAAGVAAAAEGLPLPALEQGVLGSLLVLGAFVALGARPALPVCAALTALFGLWHGYAHGVDLSPGASWLTYAIGLIVASGCLHAVGVFVASTLLGRGLPALLRLSGAAVAASGAWLWAAA